MDLEQLNCVDDAIAEWSHDRPAEQWAADPTIAMSALPPPRRRVFVVGVGMTKFEKPGRRDNFDYPQMALESATKALLDARLRYSDIARAYVGYVYGESTCGQRALYQLGQTGIPIVNVNNNCSTGSTALIMAADSIRIGAGECAMALGFEKMAPGSLTSTFNDRTNPLDWNVGLTAEVGGWEAGAPFAAQIFGNAGTEYCRKHGAASKHMAMVAEKNHRHSRLNPYAQFRDVYTLEQVMSSKHVAGPLTRLQCSPTSDGSACVIVASELFVRRHGLEDTAVEICAQVMTTDTASVFDAPTAMRLAGADMTRAAATAAFSQAGISPSDIGVVELHDCFSANELITYPALGLCPDSDAHIALERNEFTHGGRVVVNPSGGLISKGHPLGATGLAQCAELTWQLRGWCGERQVPGLRYALQHNIGLGGACVVSIYARMGGQEGGRKHAATSALGYNAAVECRPVTKEDVKRAVALDASDYLRCKM